MGQSWVQRGVWLAMWSLAMWSLAWCATSIAQAMDPFDAVPDSASVVVRWKSPQATLAKIADYVDAVQPGSGAIVKGSMPVLAAQIFSPTLKPVDVENDWWVIVFAESKVIPSVVFMIPSTDVKAFEDALPEGFDVHVEDKFVIYSSDVEALDKVVERLNGNGSALWSKIDPASKKLFDASDVSALIHVRQLAEAYDAELEQAEPKLNAALDQISAVIPDAQRSQIGAVLDMYRVLGKGVLQGVRDAQTLTCGITITKDAIRVEKRLQVDIATPTAEFLGSQPTGDLLMINRLPANKSAYIGAKLEMSGLIDWSMNVTKAMLTGTSDEQKAEFDAAVKQMRELKFGEMAMYFDLDTKSAGAMRAGSTYDVTPTDRVRDISRKLLKSMSKIEFPGFTQTTTLEPAAEKVVGGFEVDRITTKQVFDSKIDALGMQKKFQGLLFGNDGMQQRVIYQPKQILQTFGGGNAEMQNLVTVLNSTPPSKDAAIIATARKRFSEKANVIGLVDVARLIANGTKLAIQEKAIPLNVDAIDDLKIPPSFVGFSFACESTAAQTQLEIPVEQAQGIAKLVTTIIGAFR